MTLEELNSELKKLIQTTVSFKRIAGNSIIIYFFGEPGDATVVSLFINPTWRYQKQGKIIVASLDFRCEESDFNSKEEYEQTFDRMCSLTDDIKGSKLINCEIDLMSSDVTLEFSGNQILRNFANSAFDHNAWTYRNHPQNICANVSPSGIILRDK